MSERIVILAHAHPMLSQGGGEIAAHRQYKEMAKQGRDVRFIGLCNNYDMRARLFDHTQKVLEVAPGDYMLRVEDMSAFLMEAEQLEQEDFLYSFVLAQEPDVLHLHHIWKVGAGTIRRLKAARPEMEIYLTVHEYTMICALHGQMVKSDGTTLCSQASPIDCARCFPDRSPFDFILRKGRLQHVLSLCDRIFSPSAFLAGRLTEWGVARDRIEVVENGVTDIPDYAEESEEELLNKATRFGFFGNATPTKGLNVLIEAARLLEKKGNCDQISIDVYGVTVERFKELWPALPIPGNVSFRGRYQPSQAITLMRAFGWVVIPSIWWENSPVIIQEARAAKTPMIYSDLGGMAERGAGAGIPFPAGDSVALAQTMERVASDLPGLRSRKQGIAPPMGIGAYLDKWDSGRRDLGTPAVVSVGGRI